MNPNLSVQNKGGRDRILRSWSWIIDLGVRQPINYYSSGRGVCGEEKTVSGSLLYQLDEDPRREPL